MSGWNSKGQLGISSSHEFDGFFFRRIQFVEDQNKIETKHICFVAVSLGWDHSLAITGNICISSRSYHSLFGHKSYVFVPISFQILESSTHGEGIYVDSWDSEGIANTTTSARNMFVFPLWSQITPMMMKQNLGAFPKL
eukprot:Sdes_comp20527_c0_seq4m15170